MGWASAIAVLGLALTLGFAAAQGAVAVQGQAIIAGQDNTETVETVVRNTIGDPGCLGPLTTWGLRGCGSIGLVGEGANLGVNGLGPTGVLGAGSQTGVEGVADGEGGTGVFGSYNELTGTGVWGRSEGTGSGVYGEATANGTGVEAKSTDGTALKVVGKATFSRSGIVTLPASSGRSNVSVTLTNMSASTTIVATVQGNAVGVWVRSVGISPPTDTFKIYLSKVPSTDVRIGWFALR
jgi:hypothetical protein